MREIHEATLSEPFIGTIFDIETIGDIRDFRTIQQVVFGSITQVELFILCCETIEEIEYMRSTTLDRICHFPKPFYAFNYPFEKGVWFRQLGKTVYFEGELNEDKYERKGDAVEGLGIPQYDDPFEDNGAMCPPAWEKGEFNKVIAHNRACLLKERDILLKRYLPRHPKQEQEMRCGATILDSQGRTSLRCTRQSIRNNRCEAHQDKVKFLDHYTYTIDTQGKKAIAIASLREEERRESGYGD